MNNILSFFNSIGHQLTPYLSDISMAIIVCSLIMIGSSINRSVRSLLYRYHFLIRTTAFIAINVFGYALLIIKASPLLASFLDSLQPALMLAIVVAIFIFIGIWGQKNRQV